MVSEVANKSLDSKFIRKEQEENLSMDIDNTQRVEPSFFGVDNNQADTLKSIDSKSDLQEENYSNIPSFLRRNRD